MKKYICLFLVLLLSIMLFSCSELSHEIEPPDLAETEKTFAKYQDEFERIAKFLAESEYDTIQIQTHNGIIAFVPQADSVYLDKVKLEPDDKKLLKAIDKIPHAVDWLIASKYDNTVEFTLWQGAFLNGDSAKSTGICYSINGTDLPEIEYCMKLEPMKESGWYYFFEDYNEYRVTH